MKDHVKSNWEAMWDLAEGRGNEEFKGHLETCAECSQAFAEIQQMLAGLTYTNASPDSNLLNEAYGIMPGALKRLGLFGSSLMLSGSRRSESDDFQLVFGDEDFKIRVMYSLNGQSWDVMTTLPGQTFTASKDGDPIVVEDDFRVSFSVASLNDSDFVITDGEITYEIPSSTEVASDSE